MEITVCLITSCDSYETICSTDGTILITYQILLSIIMITVKLLCHLVVKQKYTEKAYFVLTWLTP